MLLDEMAYLVRLERNDDLLREAEQDRLARLALAQQERRDHFALWAMAWLGRRLVVWGVGLLERSGSGIKVDVLSAASCSQC